MCTVRRQGNTNYICIDDKPPIVENLSLINQVDNLTVHNIKTAEQKKKEESLEKLKIMRDNLLKLME